MHIRLETRALSDLRAYDNNTKRHGPADVDAIAASIGRFGFNDPIGITASGVIVEGEGRFLAAHQLGLTEVPVIVLDEMSDREINLYRIAHNKIALTTGFDLSILVQNLRELIGDDVTLSVMGFDEEMGARMLGLTANALPSGLSNTDMSGQSTMPTGEAYEFIAIWDTEAERQEFETFVRAIRDQGETAAVALIRRLEQVIHGEPSVAFQQEEHVHAV